MHFSRVLYTLLVIPLCCAAGLPAAGGNLAPNAGMEGAKPGALPPGWEPMTIGTPAKFATDTAEKHSGQASVRIDAAESTRSYLKSVEPIQVAPGEEIRASAWVKVKDVPPQTGAVIFIADFADAAGGGQVAAKFDVADVKKQGQWQQISGSLKAPALAATLHLRLGFSYTRGTCWWDDVTVTPQRPLVCRIELPEPLLTPAMKTLPVTILNRDGRKSPVTVRVTLNKKDTDLKVTLTGEAVQRVEVPVSVPRPGKTELTAAVFEAGKSAPAFAEERKATVPPPLVLGVPSPTHWVIEDGKPKIEGTIDFAVADELRAGRELQLRVENGAKQPLPGRPVVRQSLGGHGKYTFEFGQDVAAGDYRIVAELPASSGGPARVEQPWHVIRRAQARTTINDAGYCVAGGKPVFPLGIFNGGKFKEQAEAGFTVTHAYNAVRVEEDERHADQNALNYIEGTQANGMKMLFMVPMKPVIRGDWDVVRRRIRMFRNHPGLLAWDEEEGFARGDFHADTLTTLRKILLEEDPNHPFMVGDSKDVITRIGKDRSDFFPVGEMDLGMWWWYPFPLKSSERGNALEGDEGAPGSELVPPSFLVNAHVKQPLWVGVQSYKKPAKDARFPTPTEYRTQAYLGLISGAKGLMWYGGYVTGGIFNGKNEEEGHWEDLKKVVAELRSLEDVLMLPSTGSPEVPPGAPLSVMMKQAKDRAVLVAVNRGASPIEVSVTSAELKPGSAKVLGENREASIRAGSLRDRFEPYATHVYELPK